MDLERFLTSIKELDKKKTGKKEHLERLQKFFERFYLLNRNYLDKETYERAQKSIPSIAEAIANTLHYLDEEITRLRNKRTKLPVENVELSGMQKVKSRNEVLLKEHLTEYSD